MHVASGSRPRFGGFSREGLELLRQFDANNAATWFQAHGGIFNELVVKPARDLVIELGPMLQTRLCPVLRAEPYLGGSIVPIAHDARYSKDVPHCTCVELWFWEGHGSSHQHPGLFVRVAPSHLALGAGITLFPPELLLRYRELVNMPASGRKLVGILHQLTGAGAQVTGACLPRVPRAYPADHERGVLLRRIGLTVERTRRLPELMPESVLGPALLELIVSELARFLPLHAWLRRCDRV